MAKEFDEISAPLGTVVKIIVGLFAALFILIAVLSSVIIINTGEVGVLLEFGKAKEVLQPGIHFVIPFINSVEYMSVQIEKYETLASAASKDLQIVHATVAVNYQLINSPENVLKTWQNFQGAYVERIIAPLLQEAVKANTAKYTADELITKRSEIKEKISVDVKKKLDSYGIQVYEVSITNFDFSPEFNAAIEQKVVAEQNKQRAQFELEQKQIDVQKSIAEANAAATSQVIKANADATAQLINANATATATVIRADADAKAIQTVNQALTPLYIKYNYVNVWNGVLPKVMGSSNILVPLDDLNSSG
jgi:regulator of protease activity HflC (stomatin/prohibitin superfamily)